MIRSLNPRYYVYFVDSWNQKGLMEFPEKREMNLWILTHGNNCSYLKIISGFQLEERRKKNGR
jgi:hypothetical protein